MNSPSREEPKPGKAKRGGNGRMIAVDEPVASFMPTADGDEEPAVELERRFFNRELSALDYDARVLACAAEARRPALERAQFLAIFSRNLDEFFQIRVSGLRDQLGAGRVGHVAGRHEPTGADRRDPRASTELVATQTRLFEREVKPLLRAGGVRITDWDELKGPQRASFSRCSRNGSSPFSPRSRSIRRTRSRTSAICRSTLRSSSATRTAASAASRG